MLHCRGRTIVAAVAASLVSACGGDSTNPPPPPESTGFRILAGGEGTDTIGTQFTQALLVELRDDRGRPMPDHVIRFSTVLADPALPQLGNSAFVSAVDRNELRTFLSDTTDEQGRARAIVTLGLRAGPAMVIVTDPDHGEADTATFVVQPGRAARVQAGPRDTTVFIGSTFTLRTSVVDRAGNVRNDAIAHSVIGSAVAVSGSTVSAAAGGVARIVSATGTIADTLGVAVVPQGTIAGVTFGSLATINTDGSGFRVVVENVFSGVSTAWAPSGNEIAFDRSSGPVQVTNLSGVLRNASPSLASAIYPEYSRDGQWLYYSRDVWRLYRARRDGTADELVPMLSPAMDVAPSPSPDGTRLVYVRAIGSGQDQLWMLHLESGTSSSLNVLGHQPAWSPNGLLIAFIGVNEGNSIRVMNADGNAVRTVAPGSPANRYGFGIDWSADGQWIVARNTQRGRVELINPNTGDIVPIPNTQSLSGPSWKP